KEFATLGREAWCHAQARHAKAIHLAEWHDTAGAMLALGEARLAAALVEGLLTRTYFRGGADAVSRTGVGEADLAQVGRRLAAQVLLGVHTQRLVGVLAQRPRHLEGEARGQAAGDPALGQLLRLGVRVALQLPPLLGHLVLDLLVLRPDARVLAESHGDRARDEAGHAGEH